MLLPVSEFTGVPTTNRITGKTQKMINYVFVSSVFHHAENFSTPCLRGGGDCKTDVYDLYRKHIGFEF